MVVMVVMVSLAIFFWCNVAWAATSFKFWDRPQEIFIGCENYINHYTEAQDWCETYALESMVGCLVEGGIDFKMVGLQLKNKCDKIKDNSESSVMMAYARFRSIEESKTGTENITGHHILLNRTEMIKSQEASILLYELKNRAMYCGLVLNGFWLVVFIVATMTNWLVRLFPDARLHLNGTLTTWFRGYFTLPALGKSHKMLSKKYFGFIDFYYPSRLESSIISLFFTLFVILCSVGYGSREITKFKPVARDYIHYLANRSAIMSTTLVPLVLLLSGRNNILQSFTQWDHSTFMLYHRWIARVCISGIVIHSVVASISLAMHGLYYSEIPTWYVLWGIVGTLACTVLFFGSLLYFRRHYYEAFFMSHLILAVIFLVGSWFHLADLGYSFLMNISITLILADRLLRYIRLLYFGFPKAHITYYSDDTLRVEIPRPKHYFSVPGGHCWLTFGRYFWQSHPFSCIESTGQNNTVLFLCGVKSGVTRKIANKACSAPGKSISMRVSMEGIYGRPSPTNWYKSVVFIAGGKGFPGIFSEAYSLALQNPGCSKKIKFIWITKESPSLECCEEELLALKNTSIESTIYLTRFQLESQTPDEEEKVDFIVGSSRASRDNSETHDSRKFEEKYPHISFIYSKPDIFEIISTETEECQESIAFVSCGHPAMVDAMRVAVVGILPQTDKRVDYYDQLQGWA